MESYKFEQFRSLNSSMEKYVKQQFKRTDFFHEEVNHL